MAKETSFCSWVRVRELCDECLTHPQRAPTVVPTIVELCEDLSSEQTTTDYEAYKDARYMGLYVWNCAVELSNRNYAHDEANAVQMWTAELRSTACDLLAFEDQTGPPEHRVTLFHFCSVTGAAWAKLGEHDKAAEYLSRSMHLSTAVIEHVLQPTHNEDHKEEVLLQLCNLFRESLDVYHKLQQQDMVQHIAQQACSELGSSRMPAAVRQMLFQEVGGALLQQARGCLPGHEWERLVATLELAQQLGLALEGTEGMQEAQQMATELKLEVLLLMSYARLRMGEPQLSLKCVQAVRSITPLPQDTDLALSQLAIKAHAALQQHDYLEAEVTSLCLSSAADLATCVEVLTDAAGAGCGVELLGRALGVLQERFTGEWARVAVPIVRALMPEGKEPKPQVLTFVAELLKPGSPCCHYIKRDPALSDQCRHLLQRQAVALFEAGPPGFMHSIRLQELALEYAVEPAMQAHAAKTLAVCCLGQKDAGRALQYANQAAKLQPGLAEHCYIKFKIHLTQGDFPAAEEQVEAMPGCTDFQLSLLQAACQEAVSAKAFTTAKAALQQLLCIIQRHSHSEGAAGRQGGLQGQQGGLQGQLQEGQQQLDGLCEATVSRCLVKLQLEELQQWRELQQAASGQEGQEGEQPQGSEQAQDSTVQQGGDRQRGGGMQQQGGQREQQGVSVQAAAKQVDELLDGVSSLLNGIAARVEHCPQEQFFGGMQEDAIALNLDWLSGTAWSLGLQAQQSQKHQACALLMNACGALVEAHRNPSRKFIMIQQHAFLLAAISAINVFREDPCHHNSLLLAAKLLDKAKAARKRLTDKYGSNVDSSLDKTNHVYILLQEFTIAAYSSNHAAQMAVLEQCSLNAHVQADHLLGLAACAKEQGCRQEVVVAATHMALQKMLAAACPDFQQVAFTVRSLLRMTVSDEAKLSLYRELCQIVAGLRQGSYPGREARWLVTCCWNRGAQHARFARCALACQYMGLALSMARHMGVVPDRQAMMEREVKNLATARS